MKKQVKPASTTPKKNTGSDTRDTLGKKSGGGLLKKNEFTLIVAGALVVTVVVFFVFFKASGPSVREIPPLKGHAIEKASGIESRIKALESALEKIGPEGGDKIGVPAAAGPGDLNSIQEKMSRLEMSMTLKVDALIEKMAKLEKQVADLKKGAHSKAPAKSSTAGKAKSSAKVAETLPVKSPSKTALKKKSTGEKKAPLFHTVQKGETLWSISQKYKTSVAQLRELNKMTSKDRIYPGNNILIR